MSLAQRVLFIASGLGVVAGNIVSPGLEKCLDIKAELKDDGTRETLEDMKTHDIINVQLYTCHNKHNQAFEIVDGGIKSLPLGMCLEVDGDENEANIQLAECTGKDNQKWDLLAENYAKNPASKKCMDVAAALKKDGTREVWDEIKAHKTVNVQLYECHDPEKTKRVNQLWEWAVVRDGNIGLWQVRDLGFLKSATPAHGGMIGFGIVGMASLFVAGIVTGRRIRASHPQDAELAILGE